MEDRRRIIIVLLIVIVIFLLWYFPGRRVWFVLFYEDQVESIINSRIGSAEKKLDDVIERIDDIEGRIDEMSE